MLQIDMDNRAVLPDRAAGAFQALDELLAIGEAAVRRQAGNVLGPEQRCVFFLTICGFNAASCLKSMCALGFGYQAWAVTRMILEALINSNYVALDRTRHCRW